MKKRKVTIWYIIFALCGVMLCGLVLLFIYVMSQQGKTSTNQTGNPVSQVEADGTDDAARNEVIAMTGSGQLMELKNSIDGIHLITCYVDDGQRKPFVILQHGLTGKKDNLLQFGRLLAEQGYFVVLPDAYAHGENKDAELPVLEEVVATAENFDTIIAYYQDSSFVDMDRLGLIGFSLGGLASYYYTANGAVVPKVVGTFCATPDWDTMIGTAASYTSYSNRNLFFKSKNIGDEAKRAEIDAYLAEHSPFEKLLENETTVYCILGGANDDVVPTQGETAFYEAHKATAEITLQLYESQGHEVTEENLWTMLYYFESHL